MNNMIILLLVFFLVLLMNNNKEPFNVTKKYNNKPLVHLYLENNYNLEKPSYKPNETLELIYYQNEPTGIIKYTFPYIGNQNVDNKYHQDFYKQIISADEVEEMVNFLKPLYSLPQCSDYKKEYPGVNLFVRIFDREWTTGLQLPSTIAGLPQYFCNREFETTSPTFGMRRLYGDIVRELLNVLNGIKMRY